MYTRLNASTSLPYMKLIVDEAYVATGACRHLLFYTPYTKHILPTAFLLFILAFLECLHSTDRQANAQWAYDSTEDNCPGHHKKNI